MRLVQQRQLAVGFGLAQDRPGAHRQLDGRPQARLRQRVPAGLPVDPPDHLVGIGLVELGPELVEYPQRGLGVLPRLVVALASEVHLGVVQQPQPLEMNVPDALGDLEAPAEVAVGVVPQLAVGTHHAQVVVGDGAAPVVAGALERLERALVVGERLGQGALDVGQDAQVLLGPAPQLGAGSAQLQRPVELFPGRLDGAALEIEARQGVERLGGEQGIADFVGGPVAALAELAGPHSLVPVVTDHAQPAQRLRQHFPLPVPFGRLDGGGVTLERLGHAAGTLMGPGIT